MPKRSLFYIAAITLLVSLGTAPAGARPDDPPAITTQPADISMALGPGQTTTVTFTVGASGTDPLAYQWQASANGGASWANLTNTTTYSGTAGDTLAVKVNSSTVPGTKFRCVVSNGAGPATSNAA